MPKFRVTVENPEHNDGAFAQVFGDKEAACEFEKNCEHIGLLVGVEVQYAEAELDSEDLHNSLVSSLMGAAAGDWVVRDARTENGWRMQMHLKPQDGIWGEPLAYLESKGNGYRWRLTRFGYDWYRDTGCMSDTFGDDLVEALGARIR